MEDTDFKILCGLILSLMICFGVIGNITSFITWRHGKRCSQFRGAIYLSALAISDTLVLGTSGIKYAIELLFKVNLWNLNETFCKLFHTTWHFFFLVSTWIVVAVTIERAEAVCRPLKAAVRTSKKREVIVIAIYAVAFLLINIPFTIGAVLVTENALDETPRSNTTGSLQKPNWTADVQDKSCQADPTSFYFKYDNEYHNWFIDFVLLFIAPGLILIICNAIILVALCRRKSSFVGNQTNKDVGVSGSMTARIIALSLIQLISVGPFSIAAVVPGVFEDQKAVDSVKYRDWMFICLALIWYLNNCVNFVLYSIFGRTFRRDCLELFCSVHSPSHANNFASSSKLEPDYPMTVYTKF